jgi:hypothetical protein
MFSLMKSSLTGFCLASAIAVLPTLIVARLTGQSPQVAEAAVNAEAAPQGQAQVQHENQPQVQALTDAAPPTTRPARSGGGAGGGGGFGPGFNGQGFNGPGFNGPGRNRQGGPFGRRPEAASQEEIQAAIEFFKENSPKRMEYFQNLPEGTPARATAIQKLILVYRPMQNFKETNPDLYGLLVKQVQLRDQAFVLARDGDDAGLRAKAVEIVDVSIEARTLRLGLLQKQLDQQQAQLAADKADRDSAAEKEVTSDKQDEQRLLNRVEKIQKRGQHGQSMLDFNFSVDPLADAVPIAGEKSGETSGDADNN